MALEIFQTDPYAQSCTAEVVSTFLEINAFSTNQTVFYPIGGGQPGDQGRALLEDQDELKIIDTRRDRESGEILHYCAPESELPAPGTSLELHLDWDRRYRLMRMHSCMHLLCALIPADVTGGQIHDGRGRLDFDLEQPIDKKQLEYSLNQLIYKKAKREFKWICDEELQANPKLVRTMSVQPPKGAGMVRLVHFKGVDLQPCGGTHVASSHEIGSVVVKKIEKKGRQNRRITIEFAY